MVISTGSNLEQKLKIQNAFDFIANNIVYYLRNKNIYSNQRYNSYLSNERDISRYRRDLA